MTDTIVIAPAAPSAPAEDKTTDPGAPPVAEKPASDPKPDAAAAVEGDGEDDASDDGGSKRPSRSQRQSRKIALLAQENAEYRRMLEERSPPQRQAQPQPAADDEKPPKEADFAGDYLAYERALNAYNTGKAVRDAVRKEVEQSRTQEQRQRQAEIRQEAVVAHMDRVDEAKERIADFDQVIKSGGQVQVAPEVADEILNSEKSALLQYHLAKNPDKLKELNQMSGRELAREIGRLEGRVHLPKAKLATEASPPLSNIQGGAAAAFDPFKSDDMAAYAKWRAAGGGKRAS